MIKPDKNEGIGHLINTWEKKHNAILEVYFEDVPQMNAVKLSVRVYKLVVNFAEDDVLSDLSVDAWKVIKTYDYSQEMVLGFSHMFAAELLENISDETVFAQLEQSIRSYGSGTHALKYQGVADLAYVLTCIVRPNNKINWTWNDWNDIGAFDNSGIQSAAEELQTLGWAGQEAMEKWKAYKAYKASQYEGEYSLTIGTGKKEKSWRKELAAAVPNLETKVRHPENNELWLIPDVIMSLNDHYRWPREKVADWLETLDVDLNFKTPEGSESDGNKD